MMPSRTRCAMALILGCVWLLQGVSGKADEPVEVRLPAPGRDGWESLTFPRISQHTRYTPLTVDERDAVRAESHCAASALVFQLAEIDLEQTPVLRWEWKVERGFEVDDHRVKAGDDFAARVYVLFEFEPERSSTWERLRRRTARAVFGVDLPGNALNYVWSSREPAGATWDNPYTKRSKMISRGAGPWGAWRQEEVDVLTDYRANFGEPPRLQAVALMTDSDDSCQKARAYFANVRFASRGGKD